MMLAHTTKIRHCITFHKKTHSKVPTEQKKHTKHGISSNLDIIFHQPGKHWKAHGFLTKGGFFKIQVLPFSSRKLTKSFESIVC